MKPCCRKGRGHRAEISVVSDATGPVLSTGGAGLERRRKMKKTRIEWCDSTFNPITGCRHGCEYCYAQRLAHRFGGYDPAYGASQTQDEHGNYVLESNEKKYRRDKNGKKADAPYPFGFEPTFHKYRLDQIRHWKNEKPKNVFICSMADMFGTWVPNDWKIEVLEALKEAPQHNYLFLTKDPIGYDFWPTNKHKDARVYLLYTSNMWLGLTFTGTDRLWNHIGEYTEHLKSFDEYFRRMNGNFIPTGGAHRFLSIEPILNDVCEVNSDEMGGKLLRKFIRKDRFAGDFEWVIVGAESGNRQGKVVPEREWIEKLVQLCKEAGKPLFMKDSLIPIMGEKNMLREYPEELKHQD